MVKVKLMGLIEDVQTMISDLKQNYRVCFCSDFKPCPDSEYVRCYLDLMPYDT